MSLATRCSACGTVFRVVQDQLKVSEGWVRCGRCHEIFNAIEGLFDLDREQPPSWPSATAPPASMSPVATSPVATPAIPASGEAAQAASDDASMLPEAVAPASELQTVAAARNDERETAADFADARFPSELLGDTEAQETQAPEAAQPAPGFVTAAEQRERWRRPRVRAGLSMLALLLALLLVAQVALHFRDGIGADWPRMRPLLDALCEVAGCRVEAPRRIEQLAVDSSSLVKLDPDGLYRLDIVLRNTGATEVKLPAFDLTLTDMQGQLVARKVLSSMQLGATRSALAGGAESPLRALLGGESRITGYTIEIFYP